MAGRTRSRHRSYLIDRKIWTGHPGPTFAVIRDQGAVWSTGEGRAVPHSGVPPGVGEAEGGARETVQIRSPGPGVGMRSTSCQERVTRWSLGAETGPPAAHFSPAQASPPILAGQDEWRGSSSKASTSRNSGTTLLEEWGVLWDSDLVQSWDPTGSPREGEG